MAQDIIEKIRAAAQAKGIDPEVALGIARAESGFDPNAKAKSSSASGLFQILNSTWSGNKGAPGKQFDENENIRVGTDIISKNVQSLKGFLGRDPSPKEVYAAHYFGATGVRDFLSAAPDTPTKQLFSKKVLEANPNLKDKTAGEVLAQLEGKLKIPTSNVPRETIAKKEREPLPPSLPPMAQAEPTPARATVMASASKSMPDIKSMPASYQAAFALAALADAQDDEDEKAYNENRETESEKLMREYKPVNHLAALDLSVKPITMKDGGEVDAEDADSKDIKYFSNVNKRKERGTTTESVMLGARAKAGEGSFVAGLNMANMSRDEKMQTARALMLAYTQQDPEGLGFSANVVKPQGAPAMANLMGSLPLGDGRVSAGVQGNQGYSLGYSQPLEGGQFNANLNVPRGTMGSPQLNLQFNKRFVDGGEVDAEDLTKPSFGNPNIKKQGEAARRLAAMRDVNTLPDPKTYAAVAGALGTPPDQMGFSVMHPKYKEIRNVADPAFALGTALGIAPVAQGPGMGRMVGAAERALEPAVRRTLEGGGKASEMLQALAAPPSQMFVRARPEAAARHADLQAKGLSPEEIRAQNLTLVDNRGNLIEEISDAPAVLQQKTASIPRNYYEMLKHPELESIYPTYDMPQVQIATTKRKGVPLAMASFDEREGIQGTVRSLPGDDARGVVRGTLLHEGQHAIQSIEGFTEGANPGAFIAYVQARQGKYNPDPTVNANVIREMERAYPNIGSVADNLSMRLQADKYMRYAVGDPDRYVGETLYRHMPGEVQAELARVRSNLTPDELKATPLEVSMQQLGVDPKNILEMNKMGSRPDRYIGDVEYDPSGYADGGEVDMEGQEIKFATGQPQTPVSAPLPPATRSAKELDAYIKALNPGAKILYFPEGGGTLGHVSSDAQDILNIQKGLSPRRDEETKLHELEHSLTFRAGDPLGRPKIKRVDNNYQAYYMLGDWRPMSEFTQNMADNREKLEQFFGRPLDNAYFKPETLAAIKKQQGDTSALFDEQMASLSALEQITGKSLTRDPEMKKLFPNPRVMSVYDALTGPRQTRLDPRDLPPSTPQPAYVYRDNPVTQFLHKNLLGDNFYPYKKPVRRADGGDAEPTAEELAAASTPAFIAQKSGIGRKAGPVSQALQSGQGYIEFLKGMTNVPQNFVGAPMDISNMIANVYGGGVEKPFMGSDYIKEGLRSKGLGFTPSTDPTLAAFYGAGDLGSNFVNPAGATRAGVKAAEKTGEAARMLAQDFQQYNQNLAVPGASYAVRNKGTPFTMTYGRNTETGRKQFPVMDQAEQYVKDEVAITTDKGLNDWLSNKVTAYLRRDFATPDDQFVKAAEANQLLHFVNKPIKRTELDPYYSRAVDLDLENMNLPIVRKTEGFKPKGEARTEYGQRVEDLTDASAWPVEIGDIPSPALIPPNMRDMARTNPSERLTELGTNITKTLQFEDLAFEMANMRSMPKTFSVYSQPAIKVPEEYMLTDKALVGLTLPQASNRVAKFKNWQEENRLKMASTAFFKDPTINRTPAGNGSIWINPEDLQKNPNMLKLVQDVGCDGGWCTKGENLALSYGSGENRLSILMDSKGRPKAQMTITTSEPSADNFLMAMNDVEADQFRTKYPDLAIYLESEVKSTSEYKKWESYNPPKMSITEIKGVYDKEDLTNEPYLKQIQDRIQSMNVEEVKDLDKIGMTQMPERPMQLYNFFDPTFTQKMKLADRFGSVENGIKAVRDKTIELNNGSKFIVGTDKDMGRMFEEVTKLLVGPPLNEARQLQMNLFQSPTQKALGGMIERQPTDNRRYL